MDRLHNLPASPWLQRPPGSPSPWLPNFVFWQGQVLAGAFLREGTSNIYRFLSDNNITLTFDSAAHLTVNGTDSITFDLQTSAADFTNCNNTDTTWRMAA